MGTRLPLENRFDRIKNHLRERAIEWGADLIGFASAGDFEQYPSAHRPPERARAVIVLAIWMEDPILDLWLHLPAWRAWNKPSHAFEDEILRGVSLRLSLLLEREGYWAEPAPYEPGIYLKEAGVLAGLGVIGKNNLLLTKEYGPRVRLRAVNTSAPLEPDPVMHLDYCGKCNRCIETCPARAFSTGKYGREACLGYCQANLKQVSKHAVLWCMQCSDACPIGEDKQGTRVDKASTPKKELKG